MTLCSCTANSKAPQILIFITHGKYFQPTWVLIKHWIQIHETIIITTRESESKKSICDFWTSSPPSSLNPSCWDKLLHALAHTTSTWPGLAELFSSMRCNGGRRARTSWSCGWWCWPLEQRHLLPVIMISCCWTPPLWRICSWWSGLKLTQPEMMHIILNLQRRICREKSKFSPDESFLAANFCHPASEHNQL